MAKFLLFSLLFCFNALFLTNVFASNSCGISESKTLATEVCDAPAPDSLRITSIGGSFISLAWKPAWEGATHVLYVSQKDTSGGWTAQSVLPNVSGNSITVDGLEGGKEYRFRIATKCVSGDPSELTSFVDGIALIVDLTLLGRTPKNPQPVSCQGIEYLKHNWIGFRISGEGGASFFEFKKNTISNSPFGYIMRVGTTSNIVAADYWGKYPNSIVPVIEGVIPPFRMIRITGDGSDFDDIGLVDIYESNLIEKSIDLCPILNNLLDPWKNGFSFQAFTAKETVLNPLGGGIGLPQGADDEYIEAQNPFADNLNIFIPDTFIKEGEAVVKLYNYNGQIAIFQKFKYLTSKISLSSEWLLPGFYILQIQTANRMQVLKILKIN